jgi:hypothetical protein
VENAKQNKTLENIKGVNMNNVIQNDLTKINGNESDIEANATPQTQIKKSLLDFIEQKRKELDSIIKNCIIREHEIQREIYNMPLFRSPSQDSKIEQLEHESFLNNEKYWKAVFDRDYIYGEDIYLNRTKSIEKEYEKTLPLNMLK